MMAYLYGGKSEDENGKDSMGLEGVISGSLPKPESNSPASSADKIAQRLGGDVQIIPPTSSMERIHPEVPRHYNSNWQQRAPPHYVQNSMYLHIFNSFARML